MCERNTTFHRSVGEPSPVRAACRTQSAENANYFLSHMSCFVGAFRLYLWRSTSKAEPTSVQGSAFKVAAKPKGPDPRWPTHNYLYTNMKNIQSIISILTAPLTISAVATPTLAAELNQAVIRSVYDEDATQPIAKSLIPRVVTSAGDRFAVVQYSNGAWALVLVPRG